MVAPLVADVAAPPFCVASSGFVEVSAFVAASRFGGATFDGLESSSSPQLASASRPLTRSSAVLAIERFSHRGITRDLRTGREALAEARREGFGGVHLSVAGLLRRDAWIGGGEHEVAAPRCALGVGVCYALPLLCLVPTTCLFAGLFDGPAWTRTRDLRIMSARSAGVLGARRHRPGGENRRLPS